MRLLHERAPFNFCGIEGVRFEDAKAVVLPVPYDGTASWKTGMRDGPHAIINASRNIELYDIELGEEPSSFGIYTLEELEPSTNSPLETIERVQEAVEEILEKEKFPIILGGEHSITVGAVRAVKNKIGDVDVLCLDAHADLRDEYEGSRYNHACVMRRVREISSAVQVGVRSMSKEEKEYIESAGIGESIFSTEFDIGKIIAKLGKRIYISIDVDVFDPSEVPAVGTPEPGGMRWREVCGLLRSVAKEKEIVGFDIVELCPIPGEVASDFLCAKLAYKLFGYAMKR